MLLPLVALLISPSQEVPMRIPVDFPLDTKPVLPLRLPVKAVPKATYIDRFVWVRGRHPVVWVYELPIECHRLDEKIRRQNKLSKADWTFDRYQRSNTKTVNRTGNGAVQRILIMSGKRRLVVDEDKSLVWQNVSNSDWSTLIVKEGVEEAGLLPKRWPAKALVPDALPKSLIPPLTALRGTAPTGFIRRITPSVDSLQYWVTYRIDRPLEVVKHQAAAELKLAPVSGPTGFQFYGHLPGGAFRVELFKGEKGGTRVIVSDGAKEDSNWWSRAMDAYPGLTSMGFE